jgi:hypothetical protein
LASGPEPTGLGEWLSSKAPVYSADTLLPPTEKEIMTERLDLLKIAQEEQSGDLFKYLDSIYKRSKTQPRGIRTR